MAPARVRAATDAPTPPRIAVLTRDADLLAVLRESAPQVDIASATGTPELADLLLSRSCRALVLDSALVGDAIVQVVGKLAAQFPELPLVMVGVRADETAVSRLLSAGTLYRFLHRPISPERARAFVTAALRRSDELERGGGGGAAPAAPLPARGARGAGRVAVADAPTAQSARSARSRRPLALVAAAITLAAVAALLASRGPATGPAPVPAAERASARERDTVTALPPAAAGVPDVSAAVGAPATNARDAERAAAHERLVALAQATRADASAQPRVPSRAQPQLQADADAQARRQLELESALESELESTSQAPQPQSQPPLQALPLSQAPSLPPTDSDAPLAPPGQPQARTLPATTIASTSLPDAVPAPPVARDDDPPRRAAVVQAPLRKLVDAPPAYPPRARSRGLEGWVDVAFTVGASGVPENVRVMAGQPQGVFDAAAVEAVRSWRYAAPPTPQDANVRVRFRLDR